MLQRHARSALGLAAMASLLLISTAATAHTRWNPNGLIKPRSTTDANKVGPCGEPRGANPVVLEAGATIEVEFESTIFHQGYFRIAFSPANDQGFDDYVLVDNLQDFQGQRYRSVEITLPDMECDDCTLQLIQSMLDRNPPSNYFSCADIQLIDTAEPEDTTPPADIDNLLSVPGDNNVSLMWSNPADEDFSGVLIWLSDSPISFQPTAKQEYAVGQSHAGALLFSKGNASSTVVDSSVIGNEFYVMINAFDSSLNYAAGVTTEVNIPVAQQNLAPVASLRWEQFGNSGASIDADGEQVLVQADVVDPNTGDQHVYAWHTSDNALTNISNVASQFRFDPGQLAAGDYFVEVEVTDDGEPAMSTSARFAFSVVTSDTPGEGKAGAMGAGMLLWLTGLCCIAGWRRRRV